MDKIAVIVVIIILSFFINLLYYTCWMLTDAWLLSEIPVEKSAEKPELEGKPEGQKIKG